MMMEQEDNGRCPSGRATGPSDLSPASGSSQSSVPNAWPLCGYAPGGYTCKCIHCERQFQGDKRALECLECAANSAKALIEIYQGEAAALRRVSINLHDTIRLWSEYGGPPLPKAVEEAMGAAADELKHDASGIEAAIADETPKAAQPEGREPDPKGDAQPSPPSHPRPLK